MLRLNITLKYPTERSIPRLIPLLLTNIISQNIQQQQQQLQPPLQPQQHTQQLLQQLLRQQLQQRQLTQQQHTQQQQPQLHGTNLSNITDQTSMKILNQPQCQNQWTSTMFIISKNHLHQQPTNTSRIMRRNMSPLQLWETYLSMFQTNMMPITTLKFHTEKSNKKAMKERSHINMFSLSTIPHRIMSRINNHTNLKSLIKKKKHISKKNHIKKKNHISKKNHIKKKNHIRKKRHINLKNRIRKKKLKKTHTTQMIPMNLTHTNHQKEVIWNIITIDRPDHTVRQYDGCGDGVLDIYMVMVYSLWSWDAGHGSLDLYT